MSTDVYIGIDLGGTRIRAARFGADLQMQQRTETLTRDEQGLEAVIGRIVEQARIVWPKAGARVAGLGISAPGPIDPKSGVITSPPNLQGWHDVPLRKMLMERLDCEVFVGNDANLAALAETELGAAKGYRDVVFLTISTGVGSGIVSDGKLLIGAHGLGAECGHMILVVEGERVSTLEKEAAGPAIARQAREAIQRGEKSTILERAGGNLENIDARMVSEAARAGDALGIRLIERAGRMVGLGIVTLLVTFNPQIVVLSGGVFKGTGDLFRKPMRQAIEQYTLDSNYWKDLIIAPARLDEDVSLIGAGALALKRGG